MTTDVIDVKAIVVAEEVTPPNLYGTPNPVEIIERATAQANVLSKVINDRKLFQLIGGRKHVLVEGWTTCGALVGVFAVPMWTRPVEGGWEARVEARTLSGQIVGAAEAECLRAERNWKDRDDFALRSMAQTRAASKALRLPLGWIVTLAGFDATPAEEIAAEKQQANGQQRQESRPAQPAPQQQRPQQQPPRGDDPKPLPAQLRGLLMRMSTEIDKETATAALNSILADCPDAKGANGAILIAKMTPEQQQSAITLIREVLDGESPDPADEAYA